MVPEYQRDFSWTEDNIGDFFTDLTKFIDSSENTYLFGLVIIHRDNEVYNIVDGQQRITTSTIFLCVLRDFIKERNYQKVDSLTHSINGAIGFEDGGYRLTSGLDNNEFLLNYVQGANHDYNVQHESDKLVKRAYELLRECVERYIDDSDQEIEAIKELANSFLSGFHVAYVETESLSQAFTVFETLNARGTPLKAPDLLKNHFFSKLDSNHDYIKDKWVNMINKIENSGKDLSPTQFIKYYWNSSHEFIREKELFGTVSKELKGDIYPFLIGMFDSVDLYLYIINPSKNSKYYSDDTYDHLMNLKQFGATSFCPLIMALYNTGQKECVGEVLKAVETLILRNQVIGKKTANKNERNYANWAESVSNRHWSPLKVISEVYSVVDSDADVELAFRKFAPKKSIGKVILIEIYNKNHTETKIAERGKDVHLEHIMPESNAKWMVDETTWKEYHKRIGNMILLDGLKNIRIGNETFDVKKIKYAESSIEDTREISFLDKWSIDEIEERQKKLLKEVLRIWPKKEFPVESMTLDEFL